MSEHTKRKSRSAKSRPSDQALDASFGVVAIGGGTDACIDLLQALPTDANLALLIVANRLTEAAPDLAAHTSLTVIEASDGTSIARGHLYIVRAQSCVVVQNGALTFASAVQGSDSTFDSLLHTLAREAPERAACVVLSGIEEDVGEGARLMRQAGGLVFVQERSDNDVGADLRSAIGAGVADLIAPPAEIAQSLAARSWSGGARRAAAEEARHQFLAPIVSLLRQAGHDFRLYKTPTLLRRIERRMIRAGIEPSGHDAYFQMLRASPEEVELLAKDLLINVTGFFRDPAVFERLQHELINMLQETGREPGLRIWIAGCSTGEEAYSIAILAQEAMIAADRPGKIQIFASDVDADAVALAREGFYSTAATAGLSPERLENYFSPDAKGFRVNATLRAAVVFTVQDVLNDPPFSRLHLVCCRNLLIYLGPEAQAKAIALFHFALRGGGMLLLGNAESIGQAEDRFAVISKDDRLYRRIGPNRSSDIDHSVMIHGGLRFPGDVAKTQARLRQSTIANLGQRLVLNAYAPASVLTDRACNILYSLGPIDRYLQFPSGPATQNLLLMVPPQLRSLLGATMARAKLGDAPVMLSNFVHGATMPFRVEVHAASSEGEDLILVSFLDEAAPISRPVPGRVLPADITRIAELERELDATRTDRDSAMRNLEFAIGEHQASHEEALSVNEEFQSANEELLTSKEELQSLNEELTALNSQLQETLSRQRTTSDDLQNVLYSTNVATVFLDPELRIRFFTPATRALFNVIPTDVGRPLGDLKSLAPDDALLTDAAAVLDTHGSREREIQTPDGRWFNRRVMPYRGHDRRIEGVVITFVDVTDRKHASDALNDAKRRAEQADRAKSRFLAAASHDLRQPLQSIALLQGLLEQSVSDERSSQLVSRLGHTLAGVTGMLNTLLDLNQIETGMVQPKIELFALDDLLDQLRDEFSYHAEARGITLRIRACDFLIASDPQLLEQMLRNLISNALKYTQRGKVLIGCRRRGARVHIEVWDTGLGIAEAHLSRIFEEYTQIDNPARERARGLGLGLSIVQRLAGLLGHKVSVRSREGKGSVFVLDIPLPTREETSHTVKRAELDAQQPPHARASTILLVEDDPEVRELLQLHLATEGHVVEIAADGPSAVQRLETSPVQPDLVITDHNLPNGWSGVELAERVRRAIRRPVPVIILTGDVSSGATLEIGNQNVIHLQKPVRLHQLSGTIDRALLVAASAHRTDGADTAPLLLIVDDDAHVRTVMRRVLEEDGRRVEAYASAEDLLKRTMIEANACLLIDCALPGMSGLELLGELKRRSVAAPVILMTGQSDVAMAVEAMQSGAADFIEKPVNRADLLASIDRALARTSSERTAADWKEKAASALATLTPREQQVLEQIIGGHANKNIAANLGISQRTVENHRAAIMHKTGSRSIPALARLVFAASWQFRS